MLRISVGRSPAVGGPARRRRHVGGGGHVHGGVKFYRGAPKAARAYVEADHSRADDYYLAEGTGVAVLLVATNPESGERDLAPGVAEGGTLDGDAYEAWVAGLDGDGKPKGRLRTDAHGLRFVEVVVNGPKTWSVAASIHPEISAAYDRAQDRAAKEIVSWLAANATTRIGPRGRQVQVPVDKIEAAVIRHFTSRAGDPHRHLHVQINARVLTQGRWRGLHSAGVVDSIEALNGIGHAAIACDPEFRRELARHGYTLDPDSSEIAELAPYASAFSQRAKQIGRNVARYEAEWRRDHHREEPDARLRRTWDRRAWAEARPDKVAPRSGEQLAQRWTQELFEMGFRPPTLGYEPHPATPIGSLDRDAVVELVQKRLGSRRSSWNSADIRGEVEQILAASDVVVDPQVRRELAEDLTARTVTACVPLLQRDDIPGHIRSLSSHAVLATESDLVDRFIARSAKPAEPLADSAIDSTKLLDAEQRAVVATLAGTGRLITVEGAAGAGKTTTLAAAEQVIRGQGNQFLVVTPTLKAAQVARVETDVAAMSAAWVIHQHGFRWDDDGNWLRVRPDLRQPERYARLRPGALLLIDEAGMLDQDTARALMIIADESDARVAFMGDRHQLPAVGRGGVLDHAARWTRAESTVSLETVRRFSDPAYSDLTLRMRTGEEPGTVFDTLMARGNIVVHPSDVERTAAMAEHGSTGETVIAAKLDDVSTLNATIQDRRRQDQPGGGPPPLAIGSSGPIYLGDRVATRRNDRDLDVANRDTWTVIGGNSLGQLEVQNERGTRTLPTPYVRDHVELAYATTVHGAQGDTVDRAHFVLDESSGAAATYVAMTRGRHSNTAHLVADSVNEAHDQWTAAFARDRADLGPAAARDQALADIERYGHLPAANSMRPEDHKRFYPSPGPGRGPSIGR